MIRKTAGTHGLEMMGMLTGGGSMFKSRTRAICGAALTLPEFLKKHPELAAPVV
jgi:hypothetical protein